MAVRCSSGLLCCDRTSWYSGIQATGRNTKRSEESRAIDLREMSWMLVFKLAGTDSPHLRHLPLVFGSDGQDAADSTTRDKFTVIVQKVRQHAASHSSGWVFPPRDSTHCDSWPDGFAAVPYPAEDMLARLGSGKTVRNQLGPISPIAHNSSQAIRTATAQGGTGSCGYLRCPWTGARACSSSSTARSRPSSRDDSGQVLAQVGRGG